VILTSILLFVATLFFCMRAGGGAPADKPLQPPITRVGGVLNADEIRGILRKTYYKPPREAVTLGEIIETVKKAGLNVEVETGIRTDRELKIGTRSRNLESIIKAAARVGHFSMRFKDDGIIIAKPGIFRNIGLLNLTFGNVIMLIIGMVFIYLAVKKDMEPYELLPIGFGIILGNLPLTRLMSFSGAEIQQSGILGVFFHYGLYFHNILPPLIFLGLGAMTDFGPLIANPKTLIFGAAAQVGIFIAFWGALFLGFNIHEAAAIGIIGGADGPTTIYTSAKVAPEILGITAVCAYTYMALVAIIQPPIMKLLTTKEERKIRMKMLRQVSKAEKILFPIVGTFVILLLVPLAAPLLGLFMLGNLFRESGVVPRLSDGAQNELMNIVTIFLGTAGGILLAKFMNLFLKEKINPLIGSAGVSAVPMAARISQIVGQKEDPQNFLLMHAMGANVAGVIGSAVAAGLFLSLLT
jgi:oxaloacetate decarboxylase beta subunit